MAGYENQPVTNYGSHAGPGALGGSGVRRRSVHRVDPPVHDSRNSGTVANRPQLVLRWS